jgi:hypothetical protein
MSGRSSLGSRGQVEKATQLAVVGSNIGLVLVSDGGPPKKLSALSDGVHPWVWLLLQLGYG